MMCCSFKLNTYFWSKGEDVIERFRYKEDDYASHDISSWNRVGTYPLCKDNRIFNGEIYHHHSLRRTEECECIKFVRFCVCHTHTPVLILPQGCAMKTQKNTNPPQTDTHLHLHTGGRGRYTVLLCPAIHCWKIFYLAAAASSSSSWIMQLWAHVTSSRPTLHLVCGLKYR